MIGDIIRKLRESKDMTQNTLGTILNLSPSTIGMYEQNRRFPDIDTLTHLCHLFGVSSDYLLEITDNPNPYKHSNSSETLQERIISLMKSNDLNIIFVAQATKIRKQRLEDILKDKKPDINELIVLAECLCESTDYLLRLTDEHFDCSQIKPFHFSDNPNFSQRLSYEMDNYSETEFADKLNIPIYKIKNFLNGGELPAPAILENMSQLIKKSTDYILGLSDTSREPDASGYYPFHMDEESIRRFQNVIGDRMDEYNASIYGLTYEEFNMLYHFGFVPHISVLQKMCHSNHVSSDYLLNLSDSKLSIIVTKEYDEDSFIRDYRKLDKTYQQKVNGYIAEQLLQQERDRYMRSSVAADEPLKKTGTTNSSK